MPGKETRKRERAGTGPGFQAGSAVAGAAWGSTASAPVWRCLQWGALLGLCHRAPCSCQVGSSPHPACSGPRMSPVHPGNCRARGQRGLAPSALKTPGPGNLAQPLRPPWAG